MCESATDSGVLPYLFNNNPLTFTGPQHQRGATPMEGLHCLLATPSLVISYDPVNEWLYNQWLGEHTASSILSGAAVIAQCLSAQPCAKILSDHTQLHGNWFEAAPLVGQQGLTRLAQLGITCLAWVYSPYQTNRDAMERSLHYAAAPAISLFDNVAEAYDWLQRLPPKPRRLARVPA